MTRSWTWTAVDERKAVNAEDAEVVFSWQCLLSGQRLKGLCTRTLTTLVSSCAPLSSRGVFIKWKARMDGPSTQPCCERAFCMIRRTSGIKHWHVPKTPCSSQVSIPEAVENSRRNRFPVSCQSTRRHAPNHQIEHSVLFVFGYVPWPPILNRMPVTERSRDRHHNSVADSI